MNILRLKDKEGSERNTVLVFLHPDRQQVAFQSDFFFILFQAKFLVCVVVFENCP